MEKLDQVILFNIAKFLSSDDLTNFCFSNSKIYRLIFQENAIWLFKLKFEYPNYKEYINQNGREAYKLLTVLEKLKKKFKYTGSIYDLYHDKNEFTRQKCITKLEKDGWIICNEPRRMAGQTWYLFVGKYTYIERKTILIFRGREKPTVPQYASNFGRDHKFTVKLCYNKFYRGPN